MKTLNSAFARLRALLLAAIASSPMAGSAKVDPDIAAWNEARSLGTPEAYGHYLRVFPCGRYADRAFQSAVELCFKTGERPAARSFSADMDRVSQNVDHSRDQHHYN